MKAIDLFSGCGGISLGFQNAGFEVLAAFDKWREACQVYSQNFAHPIYEIDLLEVERSELFQQWSPGIIIGGPPCQDFSAAGKRDESRGHAVLTESFANIVSRARPEFFLMENVERAKKSDAVKNAILKFKEVGYGLSSAVLDASFYGVPQKRSRFFLVGHLHSVDGFLDEALNAGKSERPLTVKEHVGDELDIEFFYHHPRNYSRRGIHSVYDPSPTVRGASRPMPPNYKKHPGDRCDPAGVRCLTTYERSRIQTFPPDFKWSGGKTNLEQMIGNAVPVKLAEHVARCILNYAGA